MSNNLNRVYLSLGGNLRNLAYRDIKIFLDSVKYRISKIGLRTISSSNNWITAPIPYSNLPYFFNCVVECIIIDKRMNNPHLLLEKLKKLEIKLGRKYKKLNISRVIDIDIIDYKGLVLNEGLILPHPRMHLRKFVLLPLSSINKNWIHPKYKKKINYLTAKIKTEQPLRKKL